MAHRGLAILAALLGLACLLYLVLGVRGNWGFVLALRAERLAALLLVAAAAAVATQIFQTVSGNRILTPAIVGFDALYILIQSVLVFALGGVAAAQIPAVAGFLGETAILVLAAVALFAALLRGAAGDVQRMVLAGIVLGVMFRSLTAFVQRLIDPNEFAMVQIVSFARFNRIEAEALWIAMAVGAAALAGAWAMRHRLDVMALGRDHAISLGLDHHRTLMAALVLVALLTATSTALVGPLAFFGLLVTSLAALLLRDHRHAVLLPGAALIAGIVLIAGQTVFERVLGLAATLGVVVEFLGGLVFLALLLGRRWR